VDFHHAPYVWQTSPGNGKACPVVPKQRWAEHLTGPYAPNPVRARPVKRKKRSFVAKGGKKKKRATNVNDNEIEEMEK